MDLRPINGIALCAGIGGLELGLHLAIPNFRCVCFVEREAYAAGILTARMEEGHLDQAPIWDDIGTFDGRPWRGRVDLISSGFPCQPFSQAGTLKKKEDDRWLWPIIARIIGEVGPEYVFLENVPGLLFGGVDSVLGSLAEMGYNAAWGRFSAAGVGAPHIRQRLFILARRRQSGGPGPHPNPDGVRRLDGGDEPPKLRSRERDDKGGQPLELRDILADPKSKRPHGGHRVQGHDAEEGPGGRCLEGGGGGDAGNDVVADPNGSGQPSSEPPLQEGEHNPDWGREGAGDGSDTDEIDALRAGPREGEIRRPEASDTNGLGCPGRPGGPSGWWAELENRNWWEVEPPLGRVVDGSSDWVDRIRSCGNAVVPLVAAFAFQSLRGALE